MPAQYTCVECGEEKPLTEYALTRGGRGHGRWRYRTCTTCQRAEGRQRSQAKYALAREIIDEMKARPCADCGVVYPPYVMHFDHRDPSEKVGNISEMMASGVTPRILVEVAKCDVVCSNCHAERTHGQRQSGEVHDGRPRADSPAQPRRVTIGVTSQPPLL